MTTFTNAWLRHFQHHANAARDKSKDITKVGACLIGHDNEILLTAFNGPAIGVADRPERRSRKDGLKYKYAAHAERNLISFAAKRGISTEGLTIYTTHTPCSACAGAIIQAGIKCVIVGYGEFKSSDGDIEHSDMQLSDANVQIVKHYRASANLERAEYLAKALLQNKFDKNGESLYYHSLRVVDNMPDGLDEDLYVAAMLHDIIEDGSVTKEFISDNFNPVVGGLVEELTHRRDRETYKQYIERLLYDWRLVLIKLCDNKDNRDPDRMFDMDEDTALYLIKKYGSVNQILQNALSLLNPTLYKRIEEYL